MIIHFTLNGAPQELTVNQAKTCKSCCLTWECTLYATVMMVSGLPVLTQ